MMNGRMSRILEHDVYLFRQGKHYRLFEKLGYFVTAYAGVSGVQFNLWAPKAKSVAVLGSFNQWDASRHLMHQRNDGSGIWDIFIAGVDYGADYKYRLTTADGQQIDKVDPFAFFFACPPLTASRVWNLDYQWSDQHWMKNRAEHNGLNSPMVIYELNTDCWHHARPGSALPNSAQAEANTQTKDRRPLTYLELADWLPAYLSDLGFTHVEFLPLTEYADDNSAGYQTTGYFAPTARFGTPQDLMHLIDRLHQQGIGVFLDWVPSHFANDAYGLHDFDGAPLFEQGNDFDSTSTSYKFNYHRFEICSFLISSALFWLEKYHLDGLRVTGVKSMLVLNEELDDQHSNHQPSYQKGREVKRRVNKFGGNEDLDAVEFLKQLNNVIAEQCPGAVTIADEAIQWPSAAKPTYLGGLGFAMTWRNEWLRDTIKFFSQPPEERKYHLVPLTFSLYHEMSEQYILPLSHEVIVHQNSQQNHLLMDQSRMHQTLIDKLPGDDWQKFANLRLLYGYLYGHSGKKLLSMGSELTPVKEPRLDWERLRTGEHQGLQYWLHDLNQLYRSEPALFKFVGTDKNYFQELKNHIQENHAQEIKAHSYAGINRQDMPKTVISFIRTANDSADNLLIVCNFTAEPQYHYQLAVPAAGRWLELLNSDLEVYGGSGCRNNEKLQTELQSSELYPYTLTLTLPPLAVLFLKLEH